MVKLENLAKNPTKKTPNAPSKPIEIYRKLERENSRKKQFA